jgi:uncharacterized protein (DUF885 family)
LGSTRPSLVAAFAILLCASPARAQGEIGTLINEYLSGYWQARPVSAATPAGVHSQDKLLEDWSAAAVNAEVSRNRSVLARLQRLNPQSLGLDARADREHLLSRIRLEIADLAVRKSPESRPDLYVLLLGDAMFQLASRQFAPATVRFNAAVERLKLYPKFLKQARLNLGSPVEIHTRKALAILPAVSDYIDKEVPNAAVQQGVEKKDLVRVQKEAHAAAAAVRDFGKWLESDLLPRAKGREQAAATLDPTVYRQIFKDLLGTEMTPEQVLQAAEQELSRAPIPAPVAADKALDAFQILTAFRQQEKESRAFTEQKKLTPIPMPDRLQFEPAPGYWPLREPVLDPAGAFEPDTAFFLHIPAAAAFTRDTVKGGLVRYAYPGGYVQRDAINHTDSVIRKVFPNAALIAGWQEYAAVIAKEAGKEGGFDTSDPAHDRAVLLDAIFDVRLNTGKITPAEAITELTGQFRCPSAEAEYRVWRALASPASLAAAYTGRLELLRLRADVRKDLGAAFILLEYHTKLLSFGAPSFASARELLKGK